MAKWKPSVVYLRGPGFVSSLRTARIRWRSLPAQESLEPRGDRNQVDVMWDYAAFPVCGRVGASFDLDRAIDAQLRDDLQGWSDRVTDAMWEPVGPDAPGWDGPDDSVIEAFDNEGRTLARRLQDALGPDASVVYQSI